MSLSYFDFLLRQLNREKPTDQQQLECLRKKLSAVTL